jgi:DNA-directed RNA polymerase III subunit RPC7
MSADLGIPSSKRSKHTDKDSYEPQETFPKFTIPRPAKLKAGEVSAVRYYKSLRSKIREETPFYITVRKRGFEEDEEDDGIVRYRDRYKPAKSHRQTLRGLSTDESFLPEELKYVIQGTGTNGTEELINGADFAALAKRTVRKYNLDDFLDVTNDEELLDIPDDEPTGPVRAEVILNEEDDELEPGARDDDADEDLDEDDYGDNYFDNGEAEHDDFAEVGGDDDG